MAQLTTNINPLQPNGFRLAIDRENYPNLQFFAVSISHPAVSLPPTEISHKRLSRVPMPGDKLDFGELSVNIILDEDMTSYIEIFQWMERIVNSRSRPPSDFVSREEATLTHTSDITLSILSSHNNKTRDIRYIDAVPTQLGDFTMESVVGDVTQLVFPVTFSYSYFDIV